MRGVNKWIGIGNVCKDPDCRYLPSGGAVTNITVACNDSYRDKNSGQQVDATEFVRVVFYGKLAEIAGEYLKKGSKVYVEGSLHTRKYQEKQTGQDRYSTEIKASSMQMLDSRGGDSQSRAPAASNGFAAAQDGATAQAGSFPAYNAEEDFNDSIPF